MRSFLELHFTTQTLLSRHRFYIVLQAGIRGKSMKMRDFLFIMQVYALMVLSKHSIKAHNFMIIRYHLEVPHFNLPIAFSQDLKLINEDLTPKLIIDILAHNDPKVADEEGACNMELEVGLV